MSIYITRNVCLDTDVEIEIEKEDIIEYLKENREEIEDILQEVYGEEYEIPEMMVRRISVEDQLKYELLIEAYKKYSLNELEKIFKK